MTTDQSDQQPPQEEQPKQRRGRAPSTKTSTGRQASGDTPKGQSGDAPKGQKADASGGKGQPARQSSSGSGASGGSTGTPAASTSPPAGGQTPPMGNLDLSRLIQEQISQAIQPVLQDFRQQLATTVQQEVKQASDEENQNVVVESTPRSASKGDTPTSEASRPPAEGSGQKAEGDGEPSRQPEGKASTQQTGGKAESTQQADGNAASTQQASKESGSPASRQQDQQQGQTSPPAPTQATQESSGQPTSEASEGQAESGSAEGEDGSEGDGASRGIVRSGLDSTLKLVERQAENVVELALTAAIGALLAERTRAAAERGAEAGIRAALDKTSGSLGTSPRVREIRSQTESTLFAILHETLDAVYADEVRTTIDRHAEEASHELLHRNFGAAAVHLSEVLQTLTQAIVAVMRRQWQRLLRLLLKVILAALDDDPTQGVRASLSDTAGV